MGEIKSPSAGQLIAVGTTTAIATVIPTTAITAAVATATTTTAAVGRTFFTRAGLVDGEVTAKEGLAVEAIDGCVHAFDAVDGDESEATWAAAFTIGRKENFGNAAVLAEKFAEICFGGVKGKVPDIHFGIHSV